MRYTVPATVQEIHQDCEVRTSHRKHSSREIELSPRLDCKWSSCSPTTLNFPLAALRARIGLEVADSGNQSSNLHFHTLGAVLACFHAHSYTRCSIWLETHSGSPIPPVLVSLVRSEKRLYGLHHVLVVSWWKRVWFAGCTTDLRCRKGAHPIHSASWQARDFEVH